MGEKRGFTREEAADYVGLKPSAFDDRVRAGLIPKRFHVDPRDTKKDTKPVFMRERLDAYLDGLRDGS